MPNDSDQGTQQLVLFDDLQAPAEPQNADDGVQVEQRAAEAREKAMDEDALRTWHGVHLQPWSRERQRLLDALVAADVPQPDLANADPIAYVNGAYPTAVKVLYLMHHKPHDWEPLRPRLLGVIDAWASADFIPPGLSPAEVESYEPERVNVPDQTLDDKMAAIRFTNAVLTSFQTQSALPKPATKKSKKSASGN